MSDVISPKRSLNQPKATHVCIYPPDKPISKGSFSVCLLFLFCSRVFISRSYENHSIWFVFFIGFVVVVVVFYTRVGIDKVKGMQKLTLF